MCPTESSCVEEDHDYLGADIIQVRHLTFYLIIFQNWLNLTHDSDSIITRIAAALNLIVSGDR